MYSLRKSADDEEKRAEKTIAGSSIAEHEFLGQHKHRSLSVDSTASTLAEEQNSGRRLYIFPRPPTKHPGPPPDGGLKAWLQVLAGSMIAAVTWGQIQSFGVFQTYYSEILDVGQSSISWIGAAQTFTLMFLCTFTGRASDAGFVHETMFVGSILIVIGTVLTSLFEKYCYLLLSQGVCTGLGMGLIYLPGISVPATYFKKKRSLAVGLITSGIGVGGVAYPAMVQHLLPRLGFGWTVRIMALVTAIVCFIAYLLIDVRLPPQRSGPLVDFAAFQDQAYVFLVIGWAVIYWGIYFIFYYIDAYGKAYAGFSTLDSIDILLITNALGIPGRIVVGAIASLWLGTLNTVIPITVATSITIYCWIDINSSYICLYVFAAIFGFVASSVQGAFPMTLVACCDGNHNPATRLGMAYTVIAFGALAGGPTAGAIIQANDGKYFGAQIWCGSVVLLGAMAFIAARITRTGLVLKVKI